MTGNTMMSIIEIAAVLIVWFIALNLLGWLTARQLARSQKELDELARAGRAFRDEALGALRRLIPSRWR